MQKKFSLHRVHLRDRHRDHLRDHRHDHLRDRHRDHRDRHRVRQHALHERGCRTYSQDCLQIIQSNPSRLIWIYQI